MIVLVLGTGSNSVLVYRGEQLDQWSKIRVILRISRNISIRLALSNSTKTPDSLPTPDMAFASDSLSTESGPYEDYLRSSILH